ncbi:hypothetical protein [Stutzerimonas xanthomarina]|uniref:hypothetical protein n=1 Tax=Stutzerimonas xanthomarina TaxID=271420 RepID=UPI00156119FC|nr:hypothetical protein [Stutzerimonas xanthomarina]
MSGDILYRENICLKYKQSDVEATLDTLPQPDSRLPTLNFPGVLVRFIAFISWGGASNEVSSRAVVGDQAGR